MTASVEKQQLTRTLLGRQPARTLIVDLSPPFDCHVGTDLCEALENLFAITCTLSGASRIPFFSIVVLNGCAEGSQSICHQVEIVITTFKPMTALQKNIEAVGPFLNLECIKRIQVVTLTKIGDITNVENLGTFRDSQTSLNSNDSLEGTNIGGIHGIVETLSLDADPLCLQIYFNAWLLDSGTDSEHLHIILPEGCNQDKAIIIKCDLQERIVNPAQLPGFSQFTVHPESSAMKMVFPTTSKALGMTIPVWKIHVTSLVPVSAICDSTIFGMPMIAQPTTCWTIDWDELESNEQTFRALCHVLLFKELAMIGVLEANMGKKVPGMRNHLEDKPRGSFVFLPSKNGTLMVKSLAVQELLLPCQTSPRLEGPSENSLTRVNESLQKLEILDTYNPLFQASGLYSFLKKQHKTAALPKPVPQKRQINSVSIINPEYLVGKQNVSNFGNASRVKSIEGKKEGAAEARFIRGSKVKLYTPFPTSL
ncbi:hypothetical protein CHS0354_010353 [Potamilus streckersoni]|uniref:Meiosis 1 arrest protein n=1 Tax=Potamilus streckersoni TaxID=2493646 RepID=A0AAE0WAV4_9BIVA|nr:hypothetical protein CHS0354_010353 [Potamilus streckersoni]